MKYNDTIDNIFKLIDLALKPILIQMGFSFLHVV